MMPRHSWRACADDHMVTPYHLEELLEPAFERAFATSGRPRPTFSP